MFKAFATPAVERKVIFCIELDVKIWIYECLIYFRNQFIQHDDTFNSVKLFFRNCARRSIGRSIGHVDVARVLPLCMDLYISILMDILNSLHMKTVKFLWNSCEIKEWSSYDFFSNIVFLCVWVYYNYLQQLSISPVAVQ